MDSMKKNTSIWYFVRNILFCILYISIVQWTHAQYYSHKMMQEGNGFVFPFYVDILYLLVLMLPFIIWFIRLCRQYHWNSLRSGIIFVVRRKWSQFAVYYIVLYFCTEHYLAGNLYDESMSGTLLSYCYYLFESPVSILFYILAPFVCYTAWVVRWQSNTGERH